MGSFSTSTENGLVSVSAGASGFPAVDIRLVPRLDSVEEGGFKNLTFFCFEAEDGVTLSLDFPGKFTGCKEHEYRRRIVDANI